MMRTNKKLMISLCGLALSSLFVLNNKSVVHAAAVDANSSQENAISWDSDSDQAQDVQQTPVIQNRTQEAAQFGRKAGSADNNQQNVQSVNVNHAEIATVSSSSEQNNRTNIINAQNTPVQAKQKVASVQDAQAVNPVVIKNPAGNKVHVNWVNSKDETIPNVNGYDIDLTKAQSTDEYRWLPDGYSLKNKNQYKVNHSSNTEYYSTDYPDAEFGYTKDGKRKIYWSQKDGYTHNFTDEYGDFCISEDGKKWSGDKNKFSDNDLNNMWKEANIPSFNSINTGASYEKQVNKFHRTNTTNTYTFIDNSGNALSTSGNTVNVVLIKPRSLNLANDTRMKATATRTIKINFPGSIPPSYKNIVNDKGVLTQTVTFMRTGQEDALTGNLIDSTLAPWKSNNQDPNFLGFPERTLPRIPGYTLSIKPA